VNHQSGKQPHDALQHAVVIKHREKCRDKQMGGSALNAKMNRKLLPGSTPNPRVLPDLPKTNSAPLSEKSMKLTTILLRY